MNPGLTGDAGGPIAFNGTFFGVRGARLEVRYQDGRTSVMPITWVDAPINAGFFVFKIATTHRHVGHRPLALSLYTAKGTRLTRLQLIRR